jgi:hypothetical protein
MTLKMPRLAAFPEAFVDGLCVDGTMTLRERIEIGASLEVDGLEFYTRFLELQQPGAAAGFRRMAADLKLACAPLHLLNNFKCRAKAQLVWA